MRKENPMVGHGMLFGHVQIHTLILNYLIVKEGAGVLHLAGHMYIKGIYLKFSYY